MRFMFVALIVLMLTPPAQAAAAAYSGMVTIETKQPFDTYIDNLTKAIKANKMGIVAKACATCGAKSIGVTIPGNRVIMIFNPYFAVRMLKASVAAGIEAPLRLYVTEGKDGAARLSYRLPSQVFAPYNVPALNKMAKELDVIIGKIVAAAAR